jgi:hypothetical protein
MYDNKLTDNVIQLLQVNLFNNDFTFNNETYLQTFGVAMGKSFAPHLANLYLQQFDLQATNNFRCKPIHYHRYIDDIFFIWTDTMQDLLDYQHFLNQLIPGIHLTFQHNPDTINYLDTTVFADRTNDCLLTKVFFKPTDQHALLSQDSHHPRHTFQGIIKSQFIRYKLLSSRQTDYMATCNHLIHSLNRKGYKARKLRSMASYIWRNHSQRANPQPTDNTVYLPLTYHKDNEQLVGKIKHLMSIELKDIHVITAWRSNRNLRSILRHFP